MKNYYSVTITHTNEDDTVSFSETHQVAHIGLLPDYLLNYVYKRLFKMAMKKVKKHEQALY